MHAPFACRVQSLWILTPLANGASVCTGRSSSRVCVASKSRLGGSRSRSPPPIPVAGAAPRRVPQAHPQIEFRVDASDRIADLEAEGLDLAIRRSRPSRVDTSDHVRLLCEEFVTPALSAQLLERSGAPLHSPLDLQRLPLIEIDDSLRASFAASWRRWFETFGVSVQPSGAKMTFSFIDQAAQAAVRGQGVVLGHTPMLDDALAAGQLSAPFPDLKMPTGYSYYLVLNPQRSTAPEVVVFVRWLLEEFARGPRRQT